MIRAISGDYNLLSFKITSEGSIVMLFYEGEIKLREEFSQAKMTRFLAKGSDYIDFFENPKNAYEDNIVDFDVNGWKLTLTFAENNRRFVVSTDLKNGHTEKVAEWYI